ncbi:MAG: HlyD family efflux transporter periplasmic adaptor subunit [Chloroflexi bacterium]|nr:HlyD family efflux transporter periplasmic adaptor subunit [Chloroflexota bacterium]
MKKRMIWLLVGMLLLVGCSVGQTVEPEAVAQAQAASQTVEGGVIAEAAIEPVRWSEVRVFGGAGGTVVEVAVEEGDEVSAGDVLVRFDPIDAEIAVLEAELALASALAELALVHAGPRAEEIAAAESALEAAGATLSRSAAWRDQLTGGATEADIAAAEAALAAAEANLLVVREQHRLVHDQTDDRRKKEDADYRLYAAREMLAAAQAQLEIQRNVAGNRVREAQAGVGAAAAQQDVAQAELDLVKADSAPWEIAAAEATVQQAEAVLAAAQVRLARTVVLVPFDGVATKVHVEVGDSAAPGQVVITLAALDQLQARTIDLMELDVVRVTEGQSATVTVDALPGQAFDSVVSEVALRSEDYRGDVVYAVTVELTDEADAPLHWGMTALVEIELD